jgi:hypothetical protein
MAEWMNYSHGLLGQKFANANMSQFAVPLNRRDFVDDVPES